MMHSVDVMQDNPRDPARSFIWSAPTAVIFARGEIMTAEIQPKVAVINRSILNEDGAPNAEEILVDVVSFVCSVKLTNRERRRAARAGRKFARRVPRWLSWRIFVGCDGGKPTTAQTRQAFDLHRPPFAELARL